MIFKEIETAHINQKKSNFFITVLKDNDKGYWEIDYINQTANFRHFSTQQLPKALEDQSIMDYSDRYNTITDFLHDSIFEYIKMIIPDKKYIFSTKMFCDIIDCDKSAKIRESNEHMYCNDHKSFKIR